MSWKLRNPAIASLANRKVYPSISAENGAHIISRAPRQLFIQWKHTLITKLSVPAITQLHLLHHNYIQHKSNCNICSSTNLILIVYTDLLMTRGVL